MKRSIVFSLLLAAAVAAGIWYWRSREETAANGFLRVSGNLELLQVDIAFKTPGKLLERTVDEGQPVKKGMLIARLDRQQLLKQRMRDEAGVQSAESAYQQLTTSIDYQRATLESDVAARRAELAQAQAHLDELLAGSRRQEIQQSEAAAQDAQTQNDWARRDWERAQTLYKNEDISSAQYDQARTKFESTGAVLRQVEQRLALVREGPRQEDIAGGRAQVARAKATLQLAEASRLELRRKEEELEARRAAIEQAKAQRAITGVQLSDTEVYSPIDGVVLTKSAEVGEVLAAGATVVTIGDIQHPWLRAYVNETDLGKVKLGEKVKLTTDSFPGKIYWGRVSFIASEAEFTPRQIQTQEERVKLVYRIKIDVDNPQGELKDNMPVDAQIQLQGE